jgi:hypothetical protein
LAAVVAAIACARCVSTHQCVRQVLVHCTLHAQTPDTPLAGSHHRHALTWVLDGGFMDPAYTPARLIRNMLHACAVLTPV